jgi:Spy/CpxP family protein refolding chaperone
MRFSTAIVGMLLLTLAAGAGGGYLGVHIGLRAAENPAGLDALLHHRLDLSAAQRARIGTLEHNFAVQRRPLEAALAAARLELAHAVTAEHQYGPDVAHAVVHVHEAMQSLQQATLQHVLAMRAVLTPQQARAFDATVSEALTTDSP